MSYLRYLCLFAYSDVQRIFRGALKKIVPSRGRRENFWGISCEKSRFYAKKSYFSNFRGAREIFGVFHVKNHDFTPKKIIFLPILGGGRAPGAPPPPPPPLNPPLILCSLAFLRIVSYGPTN